MTLEGARVRRAISAVVSGNLHDMTANSGSQWSDLETSGMREARCSLLLQEDVLYEAKIKALPKQRVLVYQDKGFQPETPQDENFHVDFNGATILQLEPAYRGAKTMPVTLTVGGRCTFTPENYQDFKVLMRSKEQSKEMNVVPNGNYDWPDIRALLTCPCCGKQAPIPKATDQTHEEYWLVFYPLLQITLMNGTQLTLGTRTICRLLCLDCMEDLLEGITLSIQPGGSKERQGRLAFTLPASDILAEAGSASFLEDGPPRPDTHPHVDDILDAWTLYNLWEHSGAWEALQNDIHRMLSRSMSGEAPAMEDVGGKEPRLKERLGRPCGSPHCKKVHGQKDPKTGEVVRLTVKCRDCLSEFYCSHECREESKDEHQPDCQRKQRDREERRERKSKRVQCDTCSKNFPYTKMKKCSRCRKATYCSQECQKSDWDRHRFECQKR